MDKKLTLKQMAERLNRCERTFKKYVIEYRVPHIKLGRDMLFNPIEVETYLKNLTFAEIEKHPLSKLKSQPKVESSFKGNRFAALLNLD